MKILLVAYYYSPLEGSGVTRARHLVKRLPERGHEVSLLTHTYDGDDRMHEELIRVFDPSYNCRRRGRRFLPWLGRRLRSEWTNRTGGYASIYSAWKERIFARVAAIAEMVGPDAVMATYPPVEDLEIGLEFARSRNLPLIADFRDGLLFEAVESKPLRRFSSVRERYRAIERATLAVASAVTTVAEPLSAYFREAYNHPRVVTVANGFDPDDLPASLPELALETNGFHVVHTGRFSLSDAGCAIEPLIRAVRSLLNSRPDIAARLRLHLVGALSRHEKRLLADLVRRGTARLYGPRSRDYALAFQRRADLLLLVTGVDRRSVTTAKIFEYLQARRPILALSSQTRAAAIVSECRAGWTVPPGDESQIAAILGRIVLDKAFYESIDMTDAAIEKFSGHRSMETLDHLLRTLGGKKPLPRDVP